MERSNFNQIIRLILRLLFIASLILVFDWGIGAILKIFYFRQDYGERSRATYAIDSTFADILIFGSSRASHSYVPEIFEDRLPYTCYNTGRDGNYLLYNYALFKAIIKRYNPKLMIFDINPAELEYDAIEYERLSLLLPYYQSHPEIRFILDLRGPFEKIKRISAIYPYNSLIFPIAMGNINVVKLRLSDIKGYTPLFKTMEKIKIDTLKVKNDTIDENKILALKDIISTCQQKNIDLLFVYSPIWEIVGESLYNTIISELCFKNSISYLDMSNYPTFINNPKYFQDTHHLNDEGARVFSNMLVDKIMSTN